LNSLRINNNFCMKLIYFFIFSFPLFLNTSYSFCDAPSSRIFLDSSEKKVHGAMLGTVFRTENKAIIKPILCMNIDKCEEFDLSSYPRYESFPNKNIIWEFPGETSTFFTGKLYLLFWKENSLQEALDAQKKYANGAVRKPREKHPPRNHYDSFCDDISVEKSSILIARDTKEFGRDLSKFNFEHSVKLIYSSYSIGKMIGCGCEDYFESTKKLRPPPKNTINGKYIKKDDKLFFIEKQFDTDSRPIWGREIEVLEGDKCNIFVNEYIGKDIQIALYEPLNIKNNKVRYINACKNPIVLDHMLQ
jgi:hypothetical protein